MNTVKDKRAIPSAFTNFETRNIYDYIEAQLPPKLVELLNITVRADPYYLQTEVTFKTKAGLELVKVNLDYDFMNKHSIREAAVKIPDHVIAYLCMVPI